MLCTSSFTDDVTFGRNRPYGETRKLYHHEATTMSGVAIPGQSDVYECLFVCVDNKRFVIQ